MLVILPATLKSLSGRLEDFIFYKTSKPGVARAVYQPRNQPSTPLSQQEIETKLNQLLNHFRI